MNSEVEWLVNKAIISIDICFANPDCSAEVKRIIIVRGALGVNQFSIFLNEPDMVMVQGGTFAMGSNENNNEKPIHYVTLSSFKIAKYETTIAQFQKVMGKNPSGRKDCLDCPVTALNWEEVQTFIKKLNTLSGKNYRLPTEAEWEYAARGGTKSKQFKYAGSNDISSVAWTSINSGSRTHPVGQKQPNELELYDMSGNIFELCSDWYDENYYRKSPSNDPSASFIEGLRSLGSRLS